MHLAGADHRLQPHDTLAHDFRLLAHRVVNQPLPREQLCGQFTHVLDTNAVGEHELAQLRTRVSRNERRPHRDADEVGLAIEKRGQRRHGRIESYPNVPRSAVAASSPSSSKARFGTSSPCSVTATCLSRPPRSIRTNVAATSASNSTPIPLSM